MSADELSQRAEMYAALMPEAGDWQREVLAKLAEDFLSLA
jgi:hypothetical protein